MVKLPYHGLVRMENMNMTCLCFLFISIYASSISLLQHVTLQIVRHAPVPPELEP